MQLAALHDMLAEAQADDLHTLIASGRIYVDLHSAPLAEPQQVQLFPDQETASAYALVFKARDFDIGATAGEMPPQFAEADPADLREANRRHAMITQSITQIGCRGLSRTGPAWGAFWFPATTLHRRPDGQPRRGRSRASLLASTQCHVPVRDPARNSQAHVLHAGGRTAASASTIRKVCTGPIHGTCGMCSTR